MKLALTSRSAFGNAKPRSSTPLTTLNIVVTPQMPSARTTTARAQKARSFTSMRRPTRRSWRKVSATIVALDDGCRRWFDCSDGRREAPVTFLVLRRLALAQQLPDLGHRVVDGDVDQILPDLFRRRMRIACQPVVHPRRGVRVAGAPAPAAAAP